MRVFVLLSLAVLLFAGVALGQQKKSKADVLNKRMQYLTSRAMSPREVRGEGLDFFDIFFDFESLEGQLLLSYGQQCLRCLIHSAADCLKDIRPDDCCHDCGPIEVEHERGSGVNNCGYKRQERIIDAVNKIRGNPPRSSETSPLLAERIYYSYFCRYLLDDHDY